MAPEAEGSADAPRVVTPPAAEGEDAAAGDKDAAAAAAAAEEEALNNDILKDLFILPPRQEHGSASSDGGPLPALALPLIRPEEPVQSIRAALAEVVGLAHMTQYRLELENSDDDSSGDIKYGSWKPPLISPYTGPNAVVTIPMSQKSLSDQPNTYVPASKKILDEWGDLSPLLEQGLKSGSAFRMVLQRYDIATVKDHVARVRSLLNGNIPSVTSLTEDDMMEETAADEEQPQQPSNAEEEVGQTKDKAQAAGDAEEGTKEAGADTTQALPPIPESVHKLNSMDLKHFFYLSSGEDPNMYHGAKQPSSPTAESKSKKKKKNKNGSKDSSNANSSSDEAEPVKEVGILEQEMREKIPRWNELDDICRIDCELQWSGFHPPPLNRKWMGDLAYLEFSMTNDVGTMIHVTATRTGFYVNKCSSKAGKPKVFDPSPASEACFSHSLLDCLLKASANLRDAWQKALDASRERTELLHKMNTVSPYLSLFRVAVRADFPGFVSAASAASAAQSLDPTLHTPSWLVPTPNEKYYKAENESTSPWTHFHYHPYEPLRAEEDLSHTLGVDLRSGGIRDWNEELQLAREMPISTQHERIERARLLHKVMSEFGEAALLGVKAISEGQVTPMNPNETMRTQVYLHNNIFFSRAIDAGPETFKISKGDRAARKTANRDLQCNSILHRMEKSGLYTLATVLIDYLGTRFVCQSILPGILIGERAHKLLLGAVESGIPLKCDDELHKLLEEKIGDSMMVATRPVLRNPLTEERLEEIARLKKELPALPEPPKTTVEEKKEEEVDRNAVMMTCVPMEAKGILGSDQRKYMLDIGRFTPRDANWISADKGGTGKWEAARKEASKSSSGGSTAIPSHLDDDEWTTCVLRPELVTRFTQVTFTKYLREKKEEEAAKKEESTKKEEESDKTGEEGSGTKNESEEAPKETDAKNSKDSDAKDATAEGEEKEDAKDKTDVDKDGLSEEEKQHLKSLRMNVNAFLPDVRPLDGIMDEAAQQMKEDEQRVRDASAFLWEEVLPKLTKAVRDGNIHQLPYDGKTLTEFIHRNGVNCRYLGRLAALAQQMEQKDAKMADDLKNNRFVVADRRTMPKCWLELLEIEMVARAAKHVLDGYFVENGGAAASQPAQTVASFLSAIVSESEETAAQTETRLEKRGSNEPDEDDFASLTVSGTGGDGDALPSSIRSRFEVWQDIELEVGRRFRYSLSLFNTGNKTGRARHLPLLRRVCQRTGIRILAKNYDLGAKCLCSGGNTFGGKLTASYPISPLDFVDIVPLMKHVAAYNEGFYPCSVYPAFTLPPLQVSLQDARVALERAHFKTSARQLNVGLELAQEALGLYQRVTESPAHPGVIESMELMASIFYEGGDFALAASHGEKALGLTTQTFGFDSANVVNSHLTLFQMEFAAREVERAVKHLRAVIYLLETMAGPNHSETFSSYHKLGTTYSHGDYHNRYLSLALEYFAEAMKCDSCDRLMEGIIGKSYAKIQGGLGDYKDAVESEKKANKIFAMFLGKEHPLVKESDEELKKFTKLAVEKGNRSVETLKMKEEAAKAEAAAADLMAAEEASKGKKKNKKKGKK